MARTANADRPIELLDAVVDYMTRHGVTELSLRPLAKAVGSSPRVLLYYFGSKEELLTKATARLRERQREAFAHLAATNSHTTSEALEAIWAHMSAARSLPIFKLFFEAYAMALRHPRQYADFLRGTIEDWLEFVSGPLEDDGWDEENARAYATVLLAGFRGFILDYCASKDRARLDRAVKHWIHALQSHEASISKEVRARRGRR